MLRKTVIALMLAAGAAAAQETPRQHQLQLGLGYAAPYNLEEPFLNVAQLRAASWEFERRGGRMKSPEAVAGGYLDAETWMPTAKAGEFKNAAIAQFFSNAEGYESFYADEWVIDWKGKGYGFMHGWERRVKTERYKNSVAYTLTPAGGAPGRTGRISTSVTYDSADQPYASIAAEQDGQERAAAEAARLIHLELASWLAAGKLPG